MPYPKRYVDGVLLNWGDRLFYDPLHRLRAPRTARMTSPGSAAQLRAQIARTLRRVPEVMVKITNRPGGKRGMKAIEGHLRYISRNGKVALEDQDGQALSDAAEVKDLADEWRRGGLGIPEEMRQRFKIITHTLDQSETPLAGGEQRWDMAVVGEANDLDVRSTAASAYARARASSTLTVCFDAAVNEIRVNGEAVKFGRLCTQLAGLNRLLIEATTLTFPEILYVMAAAIKANVAQLRLMYVEPKDYRRSIEGRLCDHRDFDLSDNRRYQSIPMFRTNLSETAPGRAVFFLGYEGARLGQALEQEEMLQRWRKHAVFGVPAFESGWEIDAMANNIQHLNQEDQIQYAAAASAQAAYGLLCELRHQDKEANPILVAPLGTKPHAIGASLFLIEYESMDQAILLYDHPTRSHGRSTDVRRWHFYDVTDTLAAHLA